MTTPYRNEVSALEERKAALEAASDQVSRELRDVEVTLEAAKKRALPILDRIGVASPCSAKWDDMLGSDRERFCLSCEKNVYNVSALPRDEAEAFLQSKVAAREEICVRFYQRADGTIMTADCPVGVTKKRRKKAALAIAGAGAMALGLTSAMNMRGQHNMGSMEVGKMALVEPTAHAVDVLPAPTLEPPTNGVWVAGGLRAPDPIPQPTLKAVPPAPPTGTWLQGRRAPPPKMR